MRSAGLQRLCSAARPLLGARRNRITLPAPRCVRMASGAAFPSLVSPEWLLERQGQVKILDATWYMPNQGKDAAGEFRAERLPGARFFDLDAVCDKSTDLPHMLPSEAAFAAAADALGVSNDDAVVVYDRLGLFSAPRAWWTWRVFGHECVAVLDGGLPAWRAAGGAVDTSPVGEEELRAGAAAAAAPPQGPPRYLASLRRGEVRGWQEVLANVASGEELVVDARPAARWRGDAPEPRPGLALGHIPGSASVPWDSVQRQGRMLPAAELAAVFRAAGVSPDSARSVVASCGSGTTACILVLALQQLHPQVAAAVYDGSWSEWGALPGVPVERRPAAAAS